MNNKKLEARQAASEKHAKTVELAKRLDIVRNRIALRELRASKATKILAAYFSKRLAK